MLAAVRQDHVNLGGRFSIRGTGKLVVIWSGVTGAGSRPAPIGGFLLERRPTGAVAATITRIAWDPSAEAAEAAIWSAVEQLRRATGRRAGSPAETSTDRPFEGRPGQRSPATRYTTAFKLAAVAPVIAGLKSAREVCREMGIDALTLRRWRRAYAADRTPDDASGADAAQ